MPVAMRMRPSFSPMASEALVTRFMITCWIWALSASMGAIRSARQRRREIFFEMLTWSRRVISLTTSLRSCRRTTKRPFPE